jgi:hypothetical protein
MSREKWNQLIAYILDRLGEKTTWQALGFIISVLVSKELALFDWGQAAVIGGGVSAVIKMLLPDDVAKDIKKDV